MLSMLSSLNTMKINIAPDVIDKMGWWFCVPPIVMAAKAAFAVLEFVECQMFGTPERCYRRRW